MKKLFILLIALVFVAAACNTQNPANSNNATNPPPPPPTPTTQTYLYAPHNFEFQYPVDFVFVQPAYANLNDKIVQVQLPQNVYAGTNFVDAAFAVSTQSANSQAACLAFPAGESSSGFKDTQTINEVVYAKAIGSGAAAGNLYESRIYRTWRNNVCFELTETLHTGNLGNYPPNIVAVNKDQVWQKLDEVLTTFQFN